MNRQSFNIFLESLKQEHGNSIIDAIMEGFSTCMDYENTFDVNLDNENTSLNAIRIINKTLRYLDSKGNMYLPTRLSDFMSKIYRKIDTLEGLNNFEEFYNNYKNMNLDEIKDNLSNIRGKIRETLPERLQSLVLDI